MMRAFACITFAALLSGTAPGQPTQQRPTFEVADVHVSPRGTNTVFRTSFRGQRYEVHNASMVDLIRTAYGVETEKVFGGPTWLEFDRFDITALSSANTSQDTIKLMLQALLADRFKLVVHSDTKAGAICPARRKIESQRILGGQQPRVGKERD